MRFKHSLTYNELEDELFNVGITRPSSWVVKTIWGVSLLLFIVSLFRLETLMSLLSPFYSAELYAQDLEDVLLVFYLGLFLSSLTLVLIRKQCTPFLYLVYFLHVLASLFAYFLLTNSPSPSDPTIAEYLTYVSTIIIFVIWLSLAIPSALRLRFLLSNHLARLALGLETTFGGLKDASFRRVRLVFGLLELFLLLGLTLFFGYYFSIIILPFLFAYRIANSGLEAEEKAKKGFVVHVLKTRPTTDVYVIEREIGMPINYLFSREELKNLYSEFPFVQQYLNSRASFKPQSRSPSSLSSSSTRQKVPPLSVSSSSSFSSSSSSDTSTMSKQESDTRPLTEWEVDPDDIPVTPSNDPTIQVDLILPEGSAELSEHDLDALRFVSRSELFKDIPELSFIHQYQLDPVFLLLSAILLLVSTIIDSVVIFDPFYDEWAGLLAFWYALVAFLPLVFRLRWRHVPEISEDSNTHVFLALISISLLFPVALASLVETPFYLLILFTHLFLLLWSFGIYYSFLFFSYHYSNYHARKSSPQLFVDATLAVDFPYLVFTVILLGISPFSAILHFNSFYDLVEYFFYYFDASEIAVSLRFLFFSVGAAVTLLTSLLFFFYLFFFRHNARSTLLYSAALLWSVHPLVSIHTSRQLAIDFKISENEAKALFNFLLKKDLVK